MAEVAHRFDDSTAYERFMGNWSRAVGAVFLDWIAAPPGAGWLDVGCGTGSLARLILDRCSPAAVTGIDPSAAQIEYARQRSTAPAYFGVADAQALPFRDATFDVVASGLAINFIPDQLRGLAEMRRVARSYGVITGYVWDFAAERSPSWPLRVGMRQIGFPVPEVPGTRHSSLGALGFLFERAGLKEIAARSLEVTMRFPNFDDFWQTQTPSHNPMTRMIAAMTRGQREDLLQAVLAALPVSEDGGIEFSARANAIMGRVPR